MSIKAENNDGFDLKESITNRLAQRKDKAKSMLSFLLLDVFLGGFVVGIVLMTTLSRPVSTHETVGSGGEAFMLIEFFWDDTERLLAPVLIYNGKLKPSKLAADYRNGKDLNTAGIATVWEDLSRHSNNVWPGYQINNGIVEVDHKPYWQIAMDGFYINPKHTLKGKAVNTSSTIYNYGYLWLSEPCSGRWSIGLRQLEAGLASNVDKQLKVKIKVTWSGFQGKQLEKDANLLSYYNGVPSENITGVMGTLTSQRWGDYRTINIAKPKGDPFPWCI